MRYRYVKIKKQIFYGVKLDKNIKHYFNWKLHNWESILFNTSQVKQLICRICEQTFYLQDFIIHLCLCKKSVFYKSELEVSKKMMQNSILKLNEIQKELSQEWIFSINSKFSKEFFSQINEYDPIVIIL